MNMFEMCDADAIRAYLDNYDDEPMPVEHILTPEEYVILRAADQATYWARVSEGDPRPSRDLYTTPDRQPYSGD